MQSRKKPDFEGAVAKAKQSRNINVILVAVLLVAVLAGGVLVAFTEYKLFGIILAVILAAFLLVLLVKNMDDAHAVEIIAKNSVYASPITGSQMRIIRRHQNSRGQRFYLTAFLVLLAPEAIVLTVLFGITKNSVYLVFLAGFALVGVIVTLLSMLYLNARLSAPSPVCLVSGRGILIGREIIPFQAKRGEALQLFRFSNFYNLRFVRRAVLGIRYESDLIFPVDGGLRSGLTGSCDEELAEALCISGVFATDEDFYESRDYLAGSEVEGYVEEEKTDEDTAEQAE